MQQDDSGRTRPWLKEDKSGYDWWKGTFDTGIEEATLNLYLERMTDGDNGAIWCEARATADFAGERNTLIPPTRINLMNATRSGWKGLVSALTDAIWSVEWDEAVATGVGKAIDAYRVGEKETRLGEGTPNIGHPFLLEPFVASSGVSVFYGEGGTGKSLLGLAMGVAVAADYPLFGTAPLTPGPVVYFDYEDEDTIHEERLAAILKGADVKLRHPIYHRKLVAKVSQSQASMRRTIEDTGAVMCVLDSIGMGRGGNANTAEDTVRMFRALRSLDVPVLAIDHVSKEDKRSGDLISPYGSVYTINSARLLWGAVIAEAGSNETTKALNLKNTKANRVALHPDMGLTVEYCNSRDDETRTRWLDKVHLRVLDAWGQPEELPIGDKIEHYIKQWGPSTFDEIASFLGENPLDVRTAVEHSPRLREYMSGNRLLIDRAGKETEVWLSDERG